MEINHSSDYCLEDNEWMCTDTLLHTFQFLDFSSLIISCSLVSQQFNRVAKSNPIWRMLYEDKWLRPIVNENYWEFGEYEHYNFINLYKLKDSTDGDDEEENDDGWDKDWNEHNDPFYWFHRCMQILECLPRLESMYEADQTAFHYQLEKRDAGSEPHLKLATILAIVFLDYPFSYLKDHVVIALRDYLTEARQEIICPLVTFCMMILDSSLMDSLPIQETEDNHLCVAQFLESELNSGWMNCIDTKECCFFKLMEGYYQRNTPGGELTFLNGTDDRDRGFPWCPKFFNAGGIYYTYEIRTSCTGPCSIKVEKFESSEYY